MVFIGVFLFLIGFTAGKIIESVYLELAQRRAQTIARAVNDRAPTAWKALMSGHTVTDLKSSADVGALMAGFADEVKELNLSELKVYDLDRKVLFATRAEEIGSTENGKALRVVIESTDPGINSKTLADGSRQYELYVPVFGDAEKLRAVFELYEPVGYLNSILTTAAIPTIAIPGLLMLAFAAALNKLVNRAQADIDLRTNALNALQKRIESFVSTTAVIAARNSDSSAGIRSRKVTTTLFFSDVRDFTGFAEQNTPEAVVNFLNRLMTLQVETVKRHGGDVDKMIGDAVLARFDDADGSKRALAAAREILKAVKCGNYPRALGIGLYRGEVISGVIGPADRRDFTVIGDTVNISARLCSAAAAAEIVAEAGLADDAFGAIESIHVKGRKKPVSIRRWKA